MRNKMIELFQIMIDKHFHIKPNVPNVKATIAAAWFDMYGLVDDLIANGMTISADGGCKYCTEYADLPERFIDGKPHGRVFDTCIQDDENGWHLELPYTEDIGILFCPMCGRRLPEPPKEEV